MCFSHFREKCPPKLPISAGRGEGKGTSREPGLRPADGSSLGLCSSYILGLGRADSLCGYTSDSERDSFHVLNIHGQFPIKLQKKIVCICLLTLHQSASYLSAK